MENQNTLSLTDAEVQALSFFIDMKFPEFLAEGLSKDMAFVTAITKVFGWCQEVMAAHGMRAIPYRAYEKQTEEEMNKFISELFAYQAKKRAAEFERCDDEAEKAES